MKETSIRGGARISEALALLNRAGWITSKAIRKPNKWPRRGFTSKIEVEMIIVLNILDDDALSAYLEGKLPVEVDTKKAASPLDKQAFWRALLDRFLSVGMEREAQLLSEAQWELQEGVSLTLRFYSPTDLQLASSLVPEIEGFVREILQADAAFRVYVQPQSS